MSYKYDSVSTGKYFSEEYTEEALYVLQRQKHSPRSIMYVGRSRSKVS